MSFNRISYDKCAYSQRLSRSIAPADYRLYPGFRENCNECYALNGPRNSDNDVSTVQASSDLGFGELTSTESHLTNRVIPLSHCNNKSTDLDYKTNKVFHKPLCNRNIESNDTRFTHPVDSYRGMNTTQYKFTPYLHVNPQNNIICDETREGFSSRNYVRDNYKIPKQTIINPSKTLPPKTNKTNKTNKTTIIKNVV